MDDLQLIAEEDIGYAMAYMMDKHHIITEGAATGQNVDIAILYALIQKYITQEEK
ncbi:hypothetical protein [Planococcus sp. ISL-110]|uniref:hypothetical protein n=1 Tax=Planococcus sp. ISL-110 TaxID=2819167 RepID=UPI001BE90405|nr:hypothetical protein [Planococcus sp. ISL-110]MBT2570111.1 hypothetical protein [Planococcus sp. ISL-110]